MNTLLKPKSFHNLSHLAKHFKTPPQSAVRLIASQSEEQRATQLRLLEKNKEQAREMLLAIKINLAQYPR